MTQLPEFSITATLKNAFDKKPKGAVDLFGVLGAAKALVPLQLARKMEHALLLIASSRNEAEALYEDLASSAGEEACLHFPAWEVSPDEIMDPAGDIIAERIHTLERMAEMSERKNPFYVVASVQAFLQYVTSLKSLQDKILHVRTGEILPMETLIDHLLQRGYTREVMVEQRGDFSVRGGILDVFPMSAELPCRLEYFDDEIESIRAFEPETQRSVTRLETVKIPPCSEKDALKEAHHLKSLVPFSACFPPDTLVATVESLAVRDKAVALTEQWSQSPFFMTWQQAQAHLAKFPRLTLSQMPEQRQEASSRFAMQMSMVENFSGRTNEFWEQIHAWDMQDYRVHILCVNSGEQRRFIELLHEHGYRPERDSRITVSLGRIHAGFVSHADKMVLLSEKEVFGRRYVRRKRRRFEAGAAITEYADLRAGDYIVHEVHGIGRYQGLRRLEGRSVDYLTLRYAGGDTIYVPVTQLDQIQKYMGGDGVLPKMDRLGGATWSATKARVRRAVREMTAELVRLYAARESSEGYAFTRDTLWQTEFEDAFEYEETPDQRRAIDEVKRDMESDRPMDRLLCGDVGYGKTEVALRAAFKAVMDKKQVAMLAPTTVLVQQHYNTFRERFAAYPITVEVLNRFQSGRQIRSTLERLKSGEVDVVVGTHRLLSKDVGFRDLGLVIIDEEQRFGVRHKERLKEMRTHVDVLTMSATPIPRTLHFSLLGIRDMSVINTAPNDRLPIHTCIDAWDKELIREAITRELARDGQVFFLHNRVQTIDRVAAFLKQIVPHARVGIGHGQMSKTELESVMTGFINHETDVLLCTTIIASGIDIPNANTIIVDRADQFGLSQLYQIRGRVGRYKHRAFAYMLIPGDRSLTSEAQARLQALHDFSALGSGYRIAMRDMEIRGTGDLLGADQSGHIATVGYETYREMITEAVAEAQGKSLYKRSLPSFDLAVDAFIPDAYMPIASQKIILYRRIAALKTLEEVQELQEELRDRFGPVPRPLRRLLQIMEARARAADLGIAALEAGQRAATVYFETGRTLAQGVQAQLRRMYGDTIVFSWKDKPAMSLTYDNIEQGLENFSLLLRQLHAMMTEDSMEEEDPLLYGL
ncbi:MAG TPA: transcription-repair coupling factor [Candidatus Hydrogenedentes bacterium]|nr:transcription-repair coupling factor [Candidatus Hydrogenedentota bacterium]